MVFTGIATLAILFHNVVHFFEARGLPLYFSLPLICVAYLAFLADLVWYVKDYFSDIWEMVGGLFKFGRIWNVLIVLAAVGLGVWFQADIRRGATEVFAAMVSPPPEKH